MNDRGFTLIELLIVIAIIGILSAVATTAYVGTMKKAARSEAYGNLETLRLLQEQFYAENGDYAPSRVGTANIQVDLPGFKPGNSTNFNYEIVTQPGVGLPALPPIPYDNSTAALPDAAAPCFIAIARGIASTRVDGDAFAIDCMNNRNF
ncbi:MAG: hypothetical protein BV458_13465 [Thermoplasmata archaeon M9B2D]|nr:MAG: hypothetical protein BV458_13465 [Thermoplasmata archaeon M9B2D]